mmetsp:Transcript_62416/g.147930  ORF Transcript_62416/g.147930 Transcript_62416/m.147930 type:complete len:216 (+) Transcript_62416:838-1485(+)
MWRCSDTRVVAQVRRHNGRHLVAHHLLKSSRSHRPGSLAQRLCKGAPAVAEYLAGTLLVHSVCLVAVPRHDAHAHGNDPPGGRPADQIECFLGVLEATRVENLVKHGDGRNATYTAPVKTQDVNRTKRSVVSERFENRAGGRYRESEYCEQLGGDATVAGWLIGVLGCLEQLGSTSTPHQLRPPNTASEGDPDVLYKLGDDAELLVIVVSVESFR